MLQIAQPVEDRLPDIILLMWSGYSIGRNVYQGVKLAGELGGGGMAMRGAVASGERSVVAAAEAPVAAENTVNLASPQRTAHILYGDAAGGGHKFGLTRLFNGKSKFPATWSEDQIMNAVSEVATNPANKWVQQTGRPGSLFTRAGDPVKFKVEGVFNGVNIRVIVQGDDIITAFPIK